MNAYSILHNYDQEVYTPNFKLIANALEYKQGKVDVNEEKLQTITDQLSIIDVEKNVDREYVERRLKTAVEITDQYASLDLSQDNFAGDLIGKLSEVIDENVMNAVVSTKVYRSEQQAWAKLKEDDPDKYNQVNHSYAHQASEDWLSNQKVGDKYKGGGGVIEYQDVQGKLNKELPAITKMLGENAEYVSIEGGNGYFRDKVTRKSIDQNQVNQAMSTILNDKDMQQLHINAWGQYDKMSDDQIASKYNDTYAPTINNLETKISSLDGVIATLPEGEKKESKKQELEYLRDTLSSYKNNDYYSVVKNAGRETAYTKMYVDGFKSPYLGLYSFDQVTDIETYDNDVKTRDYELNLEKQDLAERKFGLDIRKQEFTEAQAIFKSQNGTGTSTNGKPSDGIMPIAGEKVELGYHEMEAITAQVEAEKSQITSSVKDLFEIKDAATLRELKKQVFDKGLEPGGEVTFNGKTIKLTDENMMILNDYEQNIINKSPAEKKASQELMKTLNKGLWELKKVAKGSGADVDFYNSMPSYQFKFVDDGNGKFKRVPISKENHNHYSYLLKKKDSEMTEADKITLKAYYQMHALADPKISAGSKRVLFNEMRETTFRRLDNESYNSFPGDLETYTLNLSKKTIKRDTQGRPVGGANIQTGIVLSEGMKNSSFFGKFGQYFAQGNGVVGGRIKETIYAAKGTERYITALETLNKAYENLGKQNTAEGKKEYQGKIAKLEQEISNRIHMVKTRSGERFDEFGNRSDIDQDYYLSDLTSGDMEYYDEKGSEVSLKGIDKIVDEAFGNYATAIENHRTKQAEQKSVTTLVYSQGALHKKIAPLVGLPVDTKIPITTWRGYDPQTKQMTDELYYSYTEGTGKNKVTKGYKIEDGKTVKIEEDETTKNLTVSQLEGITGVRYDQSSRVYDATMGENANKFSLGSGQYTPETKASNTLKYGTTLAMGRESFTNLMLEAQKHGNDKVEELKEVRENFYGHKYRFSIEAVGGRWAHIMRDENGKHLDTQIIEGAGTDISKEEVLQQQKDSENVINEIVYEYCRRNVLSGYVSSVQRAVEGRNDADFYKQFYTEKP